MRRASAIAITGAAVLILTALASCSASGTSGKGSPGAGTTAVPAASATANGGTSAAGDACALLSQSTAAQITGDARISKSANGSANTPSTSTCIYIDTATGASATLLIERLGTAIPAQALQGLLAQALKNGNGQVQQVNIGDAAYKEVASDSAGVVFSKGGTLAVVGTSSNARSGAAMDPDVENLARQLAGQF